MAIYFDLFTFKQLKIAYSYSQAQQNQLQCFQFQVQNYNCHFQNFVKFLRKMNDQYKQSDELIRKFNISRHRLTRNRLILVSILNLISFIVILLALVYYRYALITIKFLKQQIIGEDQLHVKQFWFNVLYIKDNNGRESFSSAADTICQGNTQCLQKIQQIALMGYCCFIFFVAGMALQLYDFYRLFLHLSMCQVQADYRDNFIRMLTVIAYTGGLIITILGLEFINVRFELGICFWIALISTILFVGLLTYQHISVKIMMKQSLILDLIESERKYTKSLNSLGQYNQKDTPVGLIKQNLKDAKLDCQLKNIQKEGRRNMVEKSEEEPSYTL